MIALRLVCLSLLAAYAYAAGLLIAGLRGLAILALAVALTGCQGDVIVIPPWYSPTQDHDLRCINDECRVTPGVGRGPL